LNVENFSPPVCLFVTCWQKTIAAMKAAFVVFSSFLLLYGVHCMDADIDVSWSNRTNRSLSSKASEPKDLQVSPLPASGEATLSPSLTSRHIPDVASIPTSSSSVP